MPVAKNDEWVPWAIAGGAAALIVGGIVTWTVLGMGQPGQQGNGNGPPPPPPPTNLALQSATFYRTAIARTHQGSPGNPLAWALPATETPTSVGNALASINPSFVSGLIRFDTGEILTAPTSALADFVTIQNIVKAANPACKFDVAIRGNEYTTGASIATDFNDVISILPSVDAFWVSVYDGMNLDTQTGAMNAAVAAGRLLGGDINVPTAVGTPASNIFVKPHYLTIPDWAFLVPPAVNMAQILGYGTPVLLHPNNSAEPVDANNNTEHADWVSVLPAQDPGVTLTFAGGTITTTVSRASYIRAMANAQVPTGFGFEYPIYWPEGMIGLYWSAPADGQMSLIQSLSSQLNIHP